MMATFYLPNRQIECLKFLLLLLTTKGPGIAEVSGMDEAMLSSTLLLCFQIHKHRTSCPIRKSNMHVI